LEPAVAAVLAKNVGVMPDRIGLMGHSWGAYQTAFVTTVSSVFKVGCAGAPLTDLVSMYNTHYWNIGIPNQPLLETGQGRLRVPFWEDPKTYIDNSPVWQSMKRKAPILITVGDQDGAVDYHQGIALYNTLRRMGKDCILLVYYGENHNFTKRPDQLDYGHRLRHFMDVYLKDAKPEPWVSQGIPFLNKDD
jgi:dipeptidyl aminopeptidase/acylaminoacyl peptidase